ncbi:MAG: glycosyltransferase family 2 protein [Pseudomonadota bacterium]
MSVAHDAPSDDTRTPPRANRADGAAITVVIPALNEAGNIGRLVDETYAALADAPLAAVIVVDDGSTDTTPDEVRERIGASGYPGLRYLRHEARSGQSTALRSGVLAASSPIIATMDGDRQNDPLDLPKMLDALAAPGAAGPKLVNGWRTERRDTGSKRWASKAANKIRDWVLRDNCPDTGCGIKVYHREAYLRLPFFTSMHRYMPALFQTYGHEVAYVPVNDRAREAGVSKYSNLTRAVVGLYDLFGVSWLRMRTRAPAIIEDSAAAPAGSELSSAPRPPTEERPV